MNNLNEDFLFDKSKDKSLTEISYLKNIKEAGEIFYFRLNWNNGNQLKHIKKRENNKELEILKQWKNLLLIKKLK